MKKDIATAEDVKLLVDHFYSRALKSEAIGYIFKDHMDIPLADHLPLMYSFWESVLLDKSTYKGNPVLKHIMLDKKVKLNATHFNEWLVLWNKSIDELFTGEKAENAKKRAALMKDLMRYKIEQSNNNPNFIQ